MARVPKTEKLFIDGPAGRLEAILETPPDIAEPRAIAVVCHPHPLHEGSMHNKVAHTLARSFLALGAPVLRFNFRGVGASEGVFDEARGEVDDALAALDYLQRRWPRARPWLSGFSFGAQVALAAANRRDLAWLVTVAPPVERMNLETFTIPACPWLLIQGGADEVVDPAATAAWLETLQPAPETEWLDGVGHYFHGNLNVLRELVVKHAPRDGHGEQA